MALVFSILNIFFQLLIVILLIRYFIEPFRFYGFGPILVSIVTLTERILQPFRQLFPRSSPFLQNQMPLFAIVLVLLIRGWFMWILRARLISPFSDIPSAVEQIPLIHEFSISLTMGLVLVAQLLIMMLFASVMIAHHGIPMYSSNAGFVCFRQRTFAVFQWVKKIIPTDNLNKLFIISAIVILLATGILASITNMSIGQLGYTMTIAIFEVLLGFLYIYWFILLLAILSSWIAADQFSLVVQLVRAMADPYLNIFRRLFPWARIDFIDLSPIFAFLVLNPGIIMLLATLEGALKSYFDPESFTYPSTPILFSIY